MIKKIKLRLDMNINMSEAKKKCIEKCNGQESETMLLSILMHKYSNYDDECWQLFKLKKEIVLQEITSLLKDISYLEPSLSWACMSKLKKYEKEYQIRNYKSQYIKH